MAHNIACHYALVQSLKHTTGKSEGAAEHCVYTRQISAFQSWCSLGIIIRIPVDAGAAGIFDRVALVVFIHGDPDDELMVGVIRITITLCQSCLPRHDWITEHSEIESEGCRRVSGREIYRDHFSLLATRSTHSILGLSIFCVVMSSTIDNVLLKAQIAMLLYWSAEHWHR